MTKPTKKKKRGRAQQGIEGLLTPEQLAQWQMIQAGMLAGDAEEDPPVFWGYKNAVEDGEPVLGKRGIQNLTPYTVKASEALGEFDKWNAAKIKAFINEAIKAGLLPKDADYFQAKELWGMLVEESIDKTTAGKQMSPWDVMSFIGGDADLAGGEETDRGPKTVTFT
jgi:hypothetical protein